jgi:predicted RNase H-like HicB family nuclease
VGGLWLRIMLTYKAMYKYLGDEGVHAEVLDFPGVISFGADLQEARRMLGAALVDMAETRLLLGEPLPQPDPSRSDPDADIEEPIHLLLTAASRVALVPQAMP